jgi:hypothetical protein
LEFYEFLITFSGTYGRTKLGEILALDNDLGLNAEVRNLTLKKYFAVQLN